MLELINGVRSDAAHVDQFRVGQTAQCALQVLFGYRMHRVQDFVGNIDADHGTDIAIFVDGIPVNLTSHGHGQGYADTHWLIPETIDLVDAFHPQTILAYEMNDEPLPVAHGAPLRLRVERQLGYKMAKYVMRIEAIESFSNISRGNGGFWEDRGYEWYAGI